MNEELNPNAINQVLRRVNHRTGDLYDFLLVASGMTGAIRMKIHDTELTMMEIRTVIMIGDHPGITATQLAQYWNRSRGAVSQILKKIELKGFIYKEKSEADEKIFHLYVTDQGMEVIYNFVSNDFEDTTHIIKSLLEVCSVEELRAFYKVMNCYRKILSDDPKSRWGVVGQPDADGCGK